MSTDDLVERAAQAAYDATQTDRVRPGTWDDLDDRYKTIFRRQAQAILNILQPPEPAPQHDPGDYDTDLFGGAA